MKKKIIVLISLLTAVSLSACSLGGNKMGDNGSTAVESYDAALADDRDYDIALITDESGIDDESSLNIWKSIIAYGDSNSKSYKYYAQGDGVDSVQAVTDAVERNAYIVVLPNASYKDTVLQLQDSYPDVCFLMVNTQNDDSFGENVHCINFKEEQAGYLAGYLLVLEGYKTLGFLGDSNNALNKRYLYGMVQGADNATQELRLHGVSIKYSFVEAKADKAKGKAEKLFKDDVEVIFAFNPDIIDGAAEAAVSAKKKIFTAENTCEKYPDVCLGTVEYDNVKAVDYSIKSGLDDELSWVSVKENKELSFGMENGCIYISTDEGDWRLKNVKASNYRSVEEKLASGEIVVSDNTDDIPPIAAVVYSEVK